MSNKSPNVAPFIIAIDGPAASGKGTIARALAAHYDYAYLDTGALYRGTAYYVLAAQGAPDNVADALAGVAQLLNNLEALDTLADAIRTQEIGAAAAMVAPLPEVRAAILDVQRDFARTPPHQKVGAILDGRDIGTVVCPDADAKLFITASAKVRAQRRFTELENRSPTLPPASGITFAAVLAEVNARDLQDKTRKTAPLRQSPDAYLLDSSDLSIEGAICAARVFIAETLKKH
ncbi:MAG: (d)CMP kinase [Alphaproteobacteria bacterium]|nr:(d)CMP kinase [Alphaproteobacteria bacterium]MBE8220159.1 (d)CMP kinase [Alphaproteobacteria bacterium]